MVYPLLSWVYCVFSMPFESKDETSERMSKSRIRFVMTPGDYERARTAYVKAFEDLMVCHRCGEKILVGQEVESHRAGSGRSNHRRKIYNHVSCPMSPSRMPRLSEMVETGRQMG